MMLQPMMLLLLVVSIVIYIISLTKDRLAFLDCALNALPILASLVMWLPVFAPLVALVCFLV